MRNRDMTVDQAKDILRHIVIQRERWGKQYDGGEIGLDAMMEALVVMGHADNHVYTELKEQLTKANRQLAAANARETKLRNQLNGLSSVSKGDSNEHNDVD